jgi:hypothetical protein
VSFSVPFGAKKNQPFLTYATSFSLDVTSIFKEDNF